MLITKVVLKSAPAGLFDHARMGGGDVQRGGNQEGVS